MELFTVIVIAASLAMDAFAVSVASGTTYRNLRLFYVLRMAIFFAIFQALMPLAGHYASIAFETLIADYDHWIAFALLFAIGCKMIHDAKKHSKEQHPNPAGLSVLIILSIATSIDALAVGVTLNLITDKIFQAVIIIGVITFLLSYAGCKAGQKLGHIFENKIEAIAGLTLIAIGTKILIQHLMQI